MASLSLMDWTDSIVNVVLFLLLTQHFSVAMVA